MPKLTTKKQDLNKPVKFLKTRHSFVFSCYHPNKHNIPETLLKELETGFHLAYYSPSLEEEPFSACQDTIAENKGTWENWNNPPKEVEENQKTAKDYFYLKEEYGNCESQFRSKWLNLPSCSAFFLFLTPEIMTSVAHLMLLMDSQQEEQQPMPVIPFVLEPVDLSSQGEDYKDTLSELEGNLTVLPEEQGYFSDLLRKIHQKLYKNSNYAGFGEDSVTTLTKIQEYLEAENPVFTKELCYRVFRELINFMECNFVNLQFYTEETMSTLYEELVSRIHSSVPLGQIPFHGRVDWVEDVDLSQFHLVTPEECEMEGDVLRKVNSTQPKIALAFPIRAIGEKAFSYSSLFEEIILPQGLEEIQESAFLYNTTLRRIYLPQSVVEIDKFAFGFCEKLEEIMIPPNIFELKANLFLGCSSLKRIHLPKMLHTFGHAVFGSCVSLEEIHLPEGVEELSQKLFNATRSLKEITLPRTLKIIGAEAFYHSGITKIHLPDSLTTIGKEAFSRCYQLEEVTGNINPENRGKNVFEDCVKLNNHTTKQK